MQQAHLSKSPGREERLSLERCSCLENQLPVFNQDRETSGDTRLVFSTSPDGMGFLPNLQKRQKLQDAVANGSSDPV